MKLPRDLDGRKLASLLRRYGYQVTRQTGNHLRLTSSAKGAQHLTIPAHKDLHLGTLHAIVSEVAAYLEVDPARLVEELFGD